MADELLQVWQRWRGGIACEQTARTWQASALRECAQRLAAELRNLGLGEGDIAVLMVANSAAFPLALLACLQLRCNPLLLHAATPPAELEATSVGIGARWIVHDFLDGISRLDPDASGAGWKTVLDLGTLQIRARRLHPRADAQPPATSEPGTILHPTSGTYGRPSLCDRPQRAAVAEARNYVETIGLFAGARVVATTPLHHAFGFGFGLVASLLADSILELRPLFHPWSLMRPERPVADVLGLVPPMVPLLTRLKTSRPVRAVRHAFFAGAPCSDAAASDYERAFDQPLYQIYGTTETGGITTTYAPGKARPGAGGPLHGVSVLVASSGRFPELDADTGEVCVRSTSMMAGYLGQRLASDTWRTGDLGRWRASGELTLVGRLRDIINVAGYNVDPREVEEVLRTHPEVLDAVAYAGRNNDGSEFVQAAVCLRLPLASGQLRDFCSDRLAAHKVPQVVHPIDSIPRTPSGKCRKNELPQTAVPAPPGGGPTEIP